MLKIVTKTSRSVIPESLVVTGIKIPPEEDHIGQGGFGRVFKGKLGRDIVALKVLHRVDNKNIVSCSYQYHYVTHSFISVQTGFLSGSIDLAIAPSQVRAAVFRDIQR